MHGAADFAGTSHQSDQPGDKDLGVSRIGRSATVVRRFRQQLLILRGALIFTCRRCAQVQRRTREAAGSEDRRVVPEI